MNWPSPPASLLGQSGPVSFADRGPLPRPGIAVVYSTRTGSAVTLVRRPPVWEARQYEMWHQVDVSRHQDLIRAEVRSRLDSMRFHLHAEVIWGVSDPAVIIDHGTTDGVSLVRAQLIDEAWRITRMFDIEQCGDAEERLRERFEAGPIVLDEGITVFKVIVKLFSDAPTARFHARHRDLVRTGTTDQALFENQIKKEKYNAELEKDRIAALRQIATGEDDLLFVFLSRHPEQVGAVIEQIGKRREINLNAQMSLFDKMVDKGFIQEADIESMRQLLLRPMEQVADSGSSSMLGGAAPPHAIAPGPAPAASSPAPAPGPPSTSGPASAAPVAGEPPAANGVAGWVKFSRASDDQDAP